MSKHPESDKVLAVRDQSQTIGEFIDWLEANGYRICSHHTSEDMRDADHPLKADLKEIEERMRRSRRYSTFDLLEHVLTTLAWLRECGECFMPASKSTEKWLEEYFGIDAEKLEAERRAMLDELRKANEPKPQPDSVVQALRAAAEAFGGDD